MMLQREGDDGGDDEAVGEGDEALALNRASAVPRFNALEAVNWMALPSAGRRLFA